MNDQNSNTFSAEQVHAFWNEVENALRSRHRYSATLAMRAMLRYRNEIDRVGSILYHRNPADVADDIVSGQYAQMDRKVG